jgi:hypothetical protein
MSPAYTTHRTHYRETPVIVTLRSDGTVLSVVNPAEYDLTRFMTDDQLHELAVQVREEGEDGL